jgi:hypothetical protein
MLAEFIEGRLTADELRRHMEADERRFLEQRKKYLLYDDR